MGRPRLGFALVLFGATLVGLMPLFVRWGYADGLTLLEVLSWRYLTPGAFALVFLPRLLRAWRSTLLPLALGVMMGIATLCYFVSLSRLSIALTVLIFFTYPMFVVVLGRLLFRRHLDVAAYCAAALVLLAALVVVSPEIVLAGRLEAVAIGFGAPLGFAIFILFSTLVVADRPVTVRLPAVLLGGLAVSLLMLVIQGQEFVLPVSLTGWIGVLGVGVASTVGGIGLMMIGGPMVGPAPAAIAGSGELVASLIVGWVMFGEALRPEVVAGAVMIIGAIVLMAPRRAGK